MKMQKNVESESSFKNSEKEKIPFKKAKYIWEVKGEFYKKPPAESSNTSAKKTRSFKALSAFEADASCSSTNIIVNNSPMYDTNCFRKLMNQNNTCNESVSSLNDDDSDADDLNGIDSDDELHTSFISDDIPITQVAPVPRNPDSQLKKWQHIQMLRGYMDNSINAMREAMRPSLRESGIFDSCEEVEEDFLVEDEGIEMAIQAHGLRSAASFYSPVIAVERLIDREVEEVKTPPTRVVETMDFKCQDVVNMAILAAIDGKGLSRK